MQALETAARNGEPHAVAAYAKAGEALGYGLARHAWRCSAPRASCWRALARAPWI